MKIRKQSLNEKLEIVLSKNTFYFYDREFEESFESYISSLAQNIFLLKNRIEKEGLSEKTILKHILEVEDGIDAILTITGFSQESLQRLITFIRIYDEPRLSKLTNKKDWCKGEFDTEWNFDRIKNLIKSNKKFAEGIVNIFFKGATISILRNTLPLFEFKKLDIKKLSFSTESLIDTIVRYKVKGSYKATMSGNPEKLIEGILKNHKLSFDKGKLKYISRNLDFIIPSKDKPKIVIECSYVTTTSSGMGDKAKTEMQASKLLKKYYPKVVFIGFVDGIGWYVRKKDLERILESFDLVFTFHEDELKKFRKLLKEVFYAKK